MRKNTKNQAMKTFFSFLWLLVLSIPAPWCRSTPVTTSSLAPDQPVIRFKETIFDYGMLPPNQPIVLQHDFNFSNAGVKDLEILSVGNACRTSSLCPMPRIKPGEASFIRVTSSLSKDYTKTEQFSRTIQVKTNDPAKPTLELNLKARFTYTLRCDRDRIEFGSNAAGSKAEQTLTICSLNEKPFKILRCECANPIFKHTMEYTTVSQSVTATMGLQRNSSQSLSQTGYLLKVQALPNGRQEGTIIGDLILYTDRQDISVLHIPLSAKIIPAINVDPPSLFLGIIRSAKPLVKDVNVFTRLPSLRIGEISTNLAGLKIERFEVAAGCRIHLTYDPSHANGPIEGELKIKTSNSDINVPIQGIVSLKAAIK